jgi:hypothetical protein
MPSDGPDNSLLLKILKSDWEDALAGGAYVMIKREKPEYLDQYEDAIGFLYDSEFSFTEEYLSSFGSWSRVCNLYT